VDTGALGEKRFEPGPKPPQRVFDPDARAVLKEENPEIFRPKEAFLEFPNDCHWPAARKLLALPRGIVVALS
jgi:hypothetical protein